MSENKFDERLITMAITAGMVDHLLDDITSAVERRRALLATEKLSQLEVDDEITLSDRISPKLLAGCPALVTGFDGEKVKIRLLAHRSYKWSTGTDVTISKNLIGTIFKKGI